MYPEKDKEKTIVILSPGVFNSAYFEHAYLAQQMGIDLVESSDLILSKDNYVYIKSWHNNSNIKCNNDGFRFLCCKNFCKWH